MTILQGSYCNYLPPCNKENKTQTVKELTDDGTSLTPQPEFFVMFITASSVGASPQSPSGPDGSSLHSRSFPTLGPRFCYIPGENIS